MSDADTVRNALGDNVEAQEALGRILGRRDAYVRQIQAERDEARRERDELREAIARDSGRADATEPGT
jgi:hypothetical protein